MTDGIDPRGANPTGLHPLLASFRAGTRDREGTAMVAALIVGSLALVLALMALTVAIGRSPVDAAAGPAKTSDAGQTATTGPTLYPSPEPTGKRYEPQPIIQGVPQKAPSYEPTTAAPKKPAETQPTAEEDLKPTDAPPTGPGDNRAPRATEAPAAVQTDAPAATQG